MKITPSFDGRNSKWWTSRRCRDVFFFVAFYVWHSRKFIVPFATSTRLSRREMTNPRAALASPPIIVTLLKNNGGARSGYIRAPPSGGFHVFLTGFIHSFISCPDGAKCEESVAFTDLLLCEIVGSLCEAGRSTDR